MSGVNRRVGNPRVSPELLEEAGVSHVELDEGSPSPPRVGDGANAKRSARAGLWRWVLGVLTMLVLVSGVAFVLYTQITKSERFVVQELDVIGARHRTAKDVAERSGLAVGDNVFSVDLALAKSRILQDPWIRDATVTRKLPATISIQVVEREASAVVILGEPFLVSRDGEVIKKLEIGDPTDLVVITGLRPENVRDDRVGTARAVRRAIDLSTDYELSGLSSTATLQEVHLREDGSVRLYVGKNLFSLELGQPPYRRKLEQAGRVIAELARRGAKPDAILLDNDLRPDRVVVRVK